MTKENRRRTDGDETWSRLREWTRGQKSAERLACHILESEGFTSIDPSHPLGGKDGLKDIVCLKEGIKWIGAGYFPRGQNSFTEIKKKFINDIKGVKTNKVDGFAFITNQELTLAQREKLTSYDLSCNIEIYHLERIVSILNTPKNYGVRQEFLDIDFTPEEILAYLARRDFEMLEMKEQNSEMLKIMEQIKNSVEKNNEIKPNNINTDEEETESPKTNEQPPMPLTIDINKTVYPKQLIDLVTNFKESLLSGKLNLSNTEKSSENEFSIARLYLFSASLLRNHALDVLGNHEIQLLYKYRNLLDLAPFERELLFNTLINDSYNLVPGWYWFSNLDDNSLGLLLSDLAYKKSRASLKKNIFELLEIAKVQPSPEWKHLLEIFIEDKDDTVRMAVASYIGSLEDITLLPLIEKLDKDSNSTVKNIFEQYKLILLLRSDVKKAFLEILQLNKLLPSKLKKVVKTVPFDNIETNLLKEGVKHQDSYIRSSSIITLLKRGEFHQDLLKTLIEHKTNKISKYCFEQIINAGFTIEINNYLDLLDIDDTEELLFTAYKHLSPEKLMDEIKWNAINGPKAYQVLATYHYSIVENTVREDIETDFVKIKNRSMEQLRLEYTDLLVSKTEKQYNEDLIKKVVEEKITFTDEINEFIKSSYLAAALCGLAVSGQPSDIGYGRQNLFNSNYWIQIGAIKLVSSFGDESDVENLLGIAKKRYGQVRKAAIEGILKLEPVLDGITKMLYSDNSYLVLFALNYLSSKQLSEYKEVVLPLLFHQNNSIREETLAFYVKDLSFTDLEAFLEKYINAPSYYYNVVCWLDRLLFSPRSLRNAYAEKLFGKIDNSEDDNLAELFKAFAGRFDGPHIT